MQSDRRCLASTRRPRCQNTANRGRDHCTSRPFLSDDRCSITSTRTCSSCEPELRAFCSFRLKIHTAFKIRKRKKKKIHFRVIINLYKFKTKRHRLVIWRHGDFQFLNTYRLQFAAGLALVTYITMNLEHVCREFPTTRKQSKHSQFCNMEKWLIAIKSHLNPENAPEQI